MAACKTSRRSNLINNLWKLTSLMHILSFKVYGEVALVVAEAFEIPLAWRLIFQLMVFHYNSQGNLYYQMLGYTIYIELFYSPLYFCNITVYASNVDISTAFWVQMELESEYRIMIFNFEITPPVTIKFRSTLLRRFAKQSIPGVPIHLRIVYLQQEIPCNADHEITVFKYLSDMMNPERSGGEDRTASLNMLREEENRLESLLLKLSSNGSEDSATLEAITNQLCDIGEQLDALESQNVTGEGTTETLDSPSVGTNDAERMADTILSWVRTLFPF